MSAKSRAPSSRSAAAPDNVGARLASDPARRAGIGRKNPPVGRGRLRGKLLHVTCQYYFQRELNAMNTDYRKSLPGTELDYFDTRAAVDAIQPGAYDKLPFTSRVLAEQLVRRCEPTMLNDALRQLVERRRDMDFPWYPARVVCHDILGQTALVDLAGLREAIAEQGGDPSQVNPVVPVQLIVDHSLAVEHPGFEKGAFEKNREVEE